MKQSLIERADTLDELIDTATELRFAKGNPRREELLAAELNRLCDLWVTDGPG